MRSLVSLEVSRGAWDAFVPYGGLHLAAVTVCALLVAGLVVTARALAAPQEAALRRGFGIFAIVYWIAYNIWWNRHELNPATGLPLHICDLNGLVAPLALLTGRRWLRATLYFWTFALTLQAFIQPTLTHGPASPVFWFFWAAHSIVIASAVYGMNGGRKIVFIPGAHPVEAGLARQQELAEGLASPSSASFLLVWRSEPALLVSRTEIRLPHFEDAVVDMRVAGWPVVLRKSGGGACPVAPGSVQVSMIDPILPQTTINGRYAVLGELLHATLLRYRVLAHTGLVAGAYCPGAYDLAVAGRKIAGMSQRWFRNRCGVRCIVTAASMNLEERPDEAASVVNRFYRSAGSTVSCDAGALTNVQLCGGPPSLCAYDFAAGVLTDSHRA